MRHCARPMTSPDLGAALDGLLERRRARGRGRRAGSRSRRGRPRPARGRPRRRASRRARGPATTSARPCAGWARVAARCGRAGAARCASLPVSPARAEGLEGLLGLARAPRRGGRCSAAPRARQSAPSAACEPGQAPLEQLEIAQRRRGVAPAPPRAADEVEHQPRRGVVVARLEQVLHAVLHDAARADGRVLRERVGGEAVDGRRVVALLEALEQVLLEQRVRPAELVVAGREQDLRARQRDERVARVHAERGAQRLQHVAAHVVAEGRRGVGAQAQLGGDRAHALVPQLGGRDGAPLRARRSGTRYWPPSSVR